MFIVLFLQACSSNSQRAPISDVTNKQNSVKPVHLSPSEQAYYALLYDEYLDWKGTPYRLGGTTRSGVDCSAFVQNIYANSFALAIPRTTKLQSNHGKKIARSQLLVGDLILFRTSWKVRHVGIYLGENKFLHASTSKGVIISTLNNVYWNDKYWQARRILH